MGALGPLRLTTSFSRNRLESILLSCAEVDAREALSSQRTTRDFVISCAWLHLERAKFRPSHGLAWASKSRGQQRRQKRAQGGVCDLRGATQRCSRRCGAARQRFGRAVAQPLSRNDAVGLLVSMRLCNPVAGMAPLCIFVLFAEHVSTVTVSIVVDPASVAAAVTTRKLDDCSSKRVAAIRISAPLISLFVLVDKKADTSSMNARCLKSLGVTVQPLGKTLPPSLNSFGGNRSNVTVPRFLLWALSLPRRFEYVWRIEDDVLYTAPWLPLLLRNSTADLLAKFSLVDPHTWYWSRSSQCMLNAEEPCAPARKGGSHSRAASHFPAARSGAANGLVAGAATFPMTYWMLLRLSVRFCAQMLSAIMFRGARGHHEALPATLCARQPGCVAEHLWSAHAKAENWHFHPAGDTAKRERDEHFLSQHKSFVADRLLSDRLYHPYKCSEHSSSGSLALKIANVSHPPPGPHARLTAWCPESPT
eukprot:4053302-Pleurochrysis_carterae.AAC.1